MHKSDYFNLRLTCCGKLSPLFSFLTSLCFERSQGPHADKVRILSWNPDTATYELGPFHSSVQSALRQDARIRGFTPISRPLPQPSTPPRSARRTGLPRRRHSEQPTSSPDQPPQRVRNSLNTVSVADNIYL